MSDPAAIPPKSSDAPAAAPPRPQQLDPRALRQQASRLARSETPPWLHAEVAQRMAERLAIIKQQPRRVLQWSAFLGAGGAALASAYPQAEQLCVEPLPALLARSQATHKRSWLRTLQGRSRTRVLAAGEALEAPVELVWANMALHGCVDPPAVLAEWQAALAVDGFLMFSCLGPDSFVELRPLYAQLGWGRPAPDWWDMHDIGDLLVAAGFADPVMDQERISLSWGEPEALLRDLRALGGNLAPQRFAGLRGRTWRAALLQALERLRGSDGRLRLSLEIVYGHAFKPAPKPRLQAETQVSLDQMREMVRRPHKR
ncbi:biotin synthase [Roseateles violae]|uniref:Biotin synthase n=1 Tax=Roseateles violae TaxID=3058042 RepID=A0ABT8DRN6_9BURK|nr:biotin synthase [Pelomonas sp. PFR6]MDN3921009.1 biotin synthase [Pelomonas sp. PFR6]